MKILGKFALLLLLFTLGIQACKPSYEIGYEQIEKAELKYSEGNYKSALRHLKRAERANYGFCGTAWVGAHITIHELRARIFFDQEEYRLARVSLSACSQGLAMNRVDTFFIRSYQMEFGKDSLRAMMDTSLANVQINNQNYPFTARLPLSNGDTLNFVLDLIRDQDIIQSNLEEERVALWASRFKATDKYAMLIGKL
tara:strand:+ start:26 stop:619 length:594 start_codon:yes stop_codon:yes gene_type:complete